ncbi:MAG: hypothetical protein AAFR37_00485 [Cyanobacteria bacterium J06628_3]
MTNAATLTGQRRYQKKFYSAIVSQKALKNQSSDTVITSIQAIGGAR